LKTATAEPESRLKFRLDHLVSVDPVGEREDKNVDMVVASALNPAKNDVKSL